MEESNPLRQIRGERKKRLLSACLIGAFLLLGANGGRAQGLWTEGRKQDLPRVRLPSFADLAETLRPAVVNISTTQVVKGRAAQPESPEENPLLGGPSGDFLRRYFSNTPPQEFERQSLGSGFIINKNGYIVTNNHVIEGASEIKVILSDKEEYDARVVGRDAKTDLALIKISPTHPLPVAPLGNSDKLRVGEWVVAIGNPFGLGHTVTIGIVSAKGRIIGAGPYDDFIQTDASINPGNSGGPLFNLRGEVVGINSAIIAGGQGLGFAIPINLAKPILLQLKEKGAVTRGWLGVHVRAITPGLAKSFGLSHPYGALVAEVTDGGPGKAAGLQRGDIIVSFDGKPIEEMTDLPRLVAGSPVGSEVLMIVLRQGKRKVLHVKIGKLQEKKVTSGEMPASSELGLAVRDLTPEIARGLGLSRNRGVFVARVTPGSPAEQAGIRRGDVIQEVDEQEVHTVQEFRREVREGAPGRSVLILINRRGNHLFVILKATG